MGLKAVARGNLSTLPGTVPVASGGTGATTARAAAAALGATFNLMSTGIPFINVSSGSIGNNGALTAITALEQTYADGAWVLYPAGAIAAGVPAAPAWYWTVFSSTTAGTIFNSVYASGQPTIGVQTAFATTGPGAFTGITADSANITFQVPAGAMGANGQLFAYGGYEATNNANGKTANLKFGATTFVAQSLNSALSGFCYARIANRGLATRQVGNNQTAQGGWGLAGAVSTIKGSNDTATALNFVWSTQKATATDNIILADATLDLTFRA